MKSLLKHQGFIKYFKNTSWLFIDKILRLFIGLFVGVWVARYLGPDNYGLLSYVASYVGLFIPLSTLGLDEVVIRELVKDISKRDVILGTAFRLKLIGTLIFFFVLSLSVLFSNDDKNTYTLIYIMACVTIFHVFNVIDYYFQSKVMSKYIVIANTIGFLSSAILKIIFIMLKTPIYTFILVGVIESFVISIGYLGAYIYMNSSSLNWIFDMKLAKTMLRDSWSLIFSGIAITIYMKIDQVMIKNMIGNEAVGYYSVAVRFSEIWSFIPVVVSGSLFPSIVNAKNESKEMYHKRLLYLFRLLVFISLIISFLILLFSKYIIIYTYGNLYIQSVEILQIYVWSIVFVFLNSSSWKWYILENLQHLAAIRLTIGALLNIVLNIIWIDDYGLKGAAYATLVSYAVSSFIGNLFNIKTISIFKIQAKALLTFYKLKGALKVIIQPRPL